MKETYKVMRDCCTSGNCLTCMHLPVGSKMRVSQMGDTKLTIEKAELIAKNWKSYKPTVEKW